MRAAERNALRMCEISMRETRARLEMAEAAKERAWTEWVRARDEVEVLKKNVEGLKRSYASIKTKKVEVPE